jgi:integrase
LKRALCPIVSAMRIPKYRKHTTRNLGFVEWKGRRRYFGGAWNSTVSRDEYLAFIRDNCGDDAAKSVKKRPFTVAELVVRFLIHARGYYSPNPRGTYANFYYALTPFSDAHGKLLAAVYGPLRLKEYRQTLIAADQARSYINDQIRRIKKCFKWGVSEELIDVNVWMGLSTVPELLAGRSKARDTAAREPVPFEYATAILHELSPTVAAMLLFQWFVGARSDSICHAMPRQFTLDGDLLLWRPKHKTQHLGKTVVLPIGPQARAIIAPFISAAPTPEHFIFSPRKHRHNGKAKERYNSTSYRQAVQRAIMRVNRRRAKEDAGKPEDQRRKPYPKWSPHQIRHARGHAVRETFGIEAVQAVLGHSTLSAAELYSAARLELAKKVARETG